MHANQCSKVVSFHGRRQKIKCLQYLATCPPSLDYISLVGTCTLGVDAGTGVEGGITIPSILWPGTYVYTQKHKKIIKYSVNT